MRVVFVATDDGAVNETAAAAARAAGIPVNVADDGARSSFILPAIVDRSPLLVAVSSGGVAPMLATAVRARLEAMLDSSWGRLARFAERWRAPIRQRRKNVAARRALYEWLLDGPVAQAVRAGHEADAERLLEQALQVDEPPPRGFVSLVGAGPGDPELLTLRALRALQSADVILADRLVGPEILARARREAEVVDVGKSAGGDGPSQERINRLLVHHARRGRRVVRLKGGDPARLRARRRGSRMARRAWDPVRDRSRHHGCARLRRLRGHPADRPAARADPALRHGTRRRVRRPDRLARPRGTPPDARRLHGGRGRGARARAVARRPPAAGNAGRHRRERHAAVAARAC